MFKAIVVSDEILAPLIKKIFSGLIVCRYEGIFFEFQPIPKVLIEKHLEALLLDETHDDVEQSIVDDCQEDTVGVKQILTEMLKIDLQFVTEITIHPAARAAAFHMEI